MLYVYLNESQFLIEMMWLLKNKNDNDGGRTIMMPLCNAFITHLFMAL